jgi:hypothetical protein
MHRGVWAFSIVIVVFLSAVLVPQPVSGEHSGDTTVTWKDWKFTISFNPPCCGGTTSHHDGVVLKQVDYRGIRAVYAAHLVAIPVFYDQTCGPYYDELRHEDLAGDTHDGVSIPAYEAKEIDPDNYRIRAHFHFFGYHYTQIWTFNNKYGWLQGELQIHPGGCDPSSLTRHYYPRWRMDLDVAGASGDKIEYYWSDGRIWITAEDERTVKSSLAGGNYNLRVTDTATSKRVYVSDLYVPYLSDRARFILLLYRSTEIEPNHDPYFDPASWDNNEDINPADIVFWYEDKVTWSPGDPTKSAGIRLKMSGF